MEKRDYLLREIEKIGILLSAIFSKITGKEMNFAVSTANQFEEEKELMLKETGFDLDHFMSLEKPGALQYLSGINGIKGQNIEILADILKEMGLRVNPAKSKEYLEQAMNLYELCSATDKTYSIERENKIRDIHTLLDRNSNNSFVP